MIRNGRVDNKRLSGLYKMLAVVPVRVQPVAATQMHTSCGVGWLGEPYVVLNDHEPVRVDGLEVPHQPTVRPSNGLTFRHIPKISTVPFAAPGCRFGSEPYRHDAEPGEVLNHATPPAGLTVKIRDDGQHPAALATIDRTVNVDAP